MYNLEQFEHGADDVMILATDGLWDVLSNKEVAEAVTSFLGNCDPDNHHRQVMQNVLEQMARANNQSAFGVYK